MGDDDRGAARKQPAQTLLDPPLGVQVDVGGRLVEHEDARVGDQRARERDQLALAGGQLRAALADLRVVAAVEAEIKPSTPTAAAAARSCSSPASGRPKAMFSLIVAREEEGLLGHDPELGAQRGSVISRRSCPSTSTLPSVGS